MTDTGSWRLPGNGGHFPALTASPGYVRRAMGDAAGVDKPRLAAAAGFPAPSGRSQFAITRGTAFEASCTNSGTLAGQDISPASRNLIPKICWIILGTCQQK